MISEQEKQALMKVYAGLVAIREALWSPDELSDARRIHLGHIADGLHNIPFDVANERFFLLRERNDQQPNSEHAARDHERE